MEEIDLKELFKMFWSEKIVIIIMLILFIEIGIIYSLKFVQPMYSASTTLVLATSNNKRELSQVDDMSSITTTDITINSKLVSTYSELVKSKNILRQVMHNLNIDMDEDELRKNINVNSVKNTELIEINVTNPNGEVSAAIANEIAKVFIETIKDIYNIENIHIVDTAEVQNIPSNINHKRDVLIFAVVGLILGFIYAFIKNLLDNTINSSEELERDYGLYTLASIPVYKNKGGNF